MGITIKSALEYLKDFDSYSPYQEAIDKVSAYIEQMQADYETRLKADLKAILVELQLEIEECVDGGEGSPQFEQGVTNARVQVVEIIHQKIQSLKEQEDGNK